MNLPRVSERLSESPEVLTKGVWCEVRVSHRHFDALVTEDPLELE
jgi:hypothetical protein